MDGIFMVNAKLDALAKRLESLDVKFVLMPTYDICKESHNQYECQMNGQFSW